MTMSLQPIKGGYRQYWNKSSVGGVVYSNLGRFMSLRSYLEVRRYIAALL